MKKLFTIFAIAILLAACSEDNDPGFTLTYVTFENAAAAELAGPTPKGENLYADYTPQLTSWTDAATGLYMPILDGWGSINFWNGGVGISQWNDLETAGDDNQCSVFYKDAVTGFGGHNGSKTFAVHNGYNSAFSDSRSEIYFSDAAAEYVFDHLWIANATYVVLALRNGHGTASAFTYENEDWFKVTIEGFDAVGESTGAVETLLADFCQSGSFGILKTWKRVDLHSLGAVHKLKFDVTSSDTGQYGMNSPGYFCIDDIAIRKVTE